MDTRIGYRELLRRSFDLDDRRARLRVEAALRTDPKLALAAAAIERAFAAPEAAVFDATRTWAALQERLHTQADLPPVRLIHPGTHGRAADGVCDQPRRRRSLAPLAAAAGVALALVGGWFALDRPGFGPAGEYWDLVAGAPLLNAVGTHEYRLGDAATLRLSGVTQLVPELLERGESAQCRLRLARGSLDAEVRPAAFARFAVVTRHATVVVAGTRFTVEADDEATVVSVVSGSVLVSRPDGSATQTLDAGKRLICRADGMYTPEELAERLRREKERAAHEERIRREAAEFSEKVFLDDGTVFTGRILSQDAAGLRIHTRHGTFTIPRERISRVQYRSQ